MLKISLCALSLLWITSAVAADTITGTVRNQTTGKPAAGDEVVLLRLGTGMQEEARTTTDGQGAFTLNVSSPSDQHLIQVSHAGVNYDQPVTRPGPVEVIVYNTVARIAGLKGKIGIAQMESDGKILNVTEKYDIVNNSNPPVTQARPDNFEIVIPAGAVFDSVDVRRGQGIWLKATPDPVKGQPGKFELNYPIRPGETLFMFTYHLPYKGATTLHLRVPYPIEKFGVMHPPSMTFKALRPNTFMSPGVMPGNLTLEAVVAVPTVGDVPAFEISGVGSAPEHGTQAEGAPPPPPAASTAPPSNDHAAPANPSAPASTSPTSTQSSKETVLMIVGILVILGLGGFMLWRMKNGQSGGTIHAKPASGKPSLDALKEELFQLENDRVHGSISAEQYTASKQALTKSIERAMKSSG